MYIKGTECLPGLLFAVQIRLVCAHTRFTTLHINGQSQGDGVCIRQDQNPGTTTNFVPSITGTEMACGTDGSLAHPSTCLADAGNQISLEHRMWPDRSQTGAIDVSHKGNTAIYMKKVDSQSDEVTGSGWFKIYYDGYDISTGEWGTDHMNANDGLVTTTIPSDLAPGQYLVRSEVLALQEVGNPQMYVGCAQIQLSGSGSATPSETAAIPGYIDLSTPEMNVNIYETFTFGEYGPKLYGHGGGDGSNGTTWSKIASKSETSGAKLSGASSSTPVESRYLASASSSDTNDIGNGIAGTSSPTPMPPDDNDSRYDGIDESIDKAPGCGDRVSRAKYSTVTTAESIATSGQTSSGQLQAEKAGFGSESHTWARWNNATARLMRSASALAAVGQV